MGEEVLAGTFFLNEQPVIILFDSGASHDFMSSTCAKKAKLSLVASGAPYVINTPGGRVDASLIVQKAPLELSGRIFHTNLIILGGKGIDVILGMSWMKLHRAVLDIADRLVHLDSPVYGKVTLHLPVISRIKASLHHVAEQKIEDIDVVREFLDVFRTICLECHLKGQLSLRLNYNPVPLRLPRLRIRCHLWNQRS
jgi:hypothetical protein